MFFVIFWRKKRVDKHKTVAWFPGEDRWDEVMEAEARAAAAEAPGRQKDGGCRKWAERWRVRKLAERWRVRYWMKDGIKRPILRLHGVKLFTGSLAAAVSGNVRA